MSSSFKLNIELNIERINEEMKRPTADEDVGAIFTAKRLQSAGEEDSFSGWTEVTAGLQSSFHTCKYHHHVQNVHVLPDPSRRFSSRATPGVQCCLYTGCLEDSPFSLFNPEVIRLHDIIRTPETAL